MINYQRLWSAAFENTSEGILITDANANILMVNNAFTAITGYPQDEVIGKNPRLLKSGRHPQKFYEQIWSSLAILGQWQGEIENRRKDGTLYPEQLSIIVVTDEQGAISNYVGIFTDLTLQKDNDEFFKHIATHDQLTDLPNRSRFFDNLNSAIYGVKLHKRQMAVLFIDLDGFKQVNDTYGHQHGDQLLITVAERLKTCISPEADAVARVGGDEFTIILGNISGAQQAAAAAEKILAELARPVYIEGSVLQITASIGISLYNGLVDDPEALLIQADQAMYEIKELGKNGYRIHS